MEAVLTLPANGCGNVTMGAYIGVSHVAKSAIAQMILFAMEAVLTLPAKGCGNVTMSAYIGVNHVVKSALTLIR